MGAGSGVSWWQSPVWVVAYPWGAGGWHFTDPFCDVHEGCLLYAVLRLRWLGGGGTLKKGSR